MLDFPMIQRMINSQGLLGNPHAMGIPNGSQTAPYSQTTPYAGVSPYTMTSALGGYPGFQDYFSPFQTLRQEWEDKNAADYAASQVPTSAVPAQPAFEPYYELQGIGMSRAPVLVTSPPPERGSLEWYQQVSDRWNSLGGSGR